MSTARSSASGTGAQEADVCRFFLRASRKRRYDRRAAKKRDELAPPHSITSSARASGVSTLVIARLGIVQSLSMQILFM
jgi:hypothetical protein